MNPIDIAWFAGIFEADGHGKVTRCGATICVTMIDKECIDRMYERLGVGKVYGPYGPTKAGNPTWRFQITDRQELARVCLAIYPLIGPKKGAQISRIADYLYDHLPRAATCVQCGEEFMPSSFRGASKRRKYCTDRCNKQAYKDRRANGLPR